MTGSVSSEKLEIVKEIIKAMSSYKIAQAKKITITWASVPAGDGLDPELLAVPNLTIEF